MNTVKFFDHGQKQDFTLWIYIFEHVQKYLNTFKNYWKQSKTFEHDQKIFELADGIGVNFEFTLQHTVKLCFKIYSRSSCKDTQ